MISSKQLNNIIYKLVLVTVAFTFFLFVFLNPTLIGKSQDTQSFFAMNDRSLCVGKTKKRAVEKSKQCPLGGIVTVRQGGRLGNQIWEYASVWTVAKRAGLEPYVPSCIRNTLDELFENLTIPILEEISHCQKRFTKVVDSLNNWKSSNQTIILPIYSRLYEETLPYLQEVREEFKLKRVVLEECQGILHAAAELSSRSAPTFVGVHVRRTDYMPYLKWKYHNVTTANSTFFLQVMEVFEEKYSDVIFVMISDDLTWCREVFSGKKNVYINKNGNSAVIDLALMASCNHTIYDYGTYGDWGSLLAGGDTIYFNLSVNPSARMGQMMPNWRTIP